MAKFRKKPVLIEAVQVSAAVTASSESMPKWFNESVRLGKISVGDETCLVETRRGAVIAQHDDWIILGVGGDLYPCRPDIFEASHEAVDEPSSVTIVYGDSFASSSPRARQDEASALVAKALKP